MTGDRHRRNPVSVRPSPEAWALIDQRAAAAGKLADQVARELIKELLELELKLEQEKEAERG